MYNFSSILLLLLSIMLPMNGHGRSAMEANEANASLLKRQV